jgi:DNA-directed RNA polymerase subunit RPC12/RpoP
VISSLERYRNDSIIINLAERHQFPCHGCGRTILRRPRAFDLNPFVRCPNKDCRAIHERIRGDGGEYLFRMVQEPFKCPDCGTGSFFDQHLLQPGARIRCRGCSKEFDLRLVVVPSPQPGQRPREGQHSHEPPKSAG